MEKDGLKKIFYRDKQIYNDPIATLIIWEDGNIKLETKQLGPEQFLELIGEVHQDIYKNIGQDLAKKILTGEDHEID